MLIRINAMPKNNVKGVLDMTVELERLVCMNHECGREVFVRRDPGLGKVKFRCLCGGELKKCYHRPELRILRTVSAEKR